MFYRGGIVLYIKNPMKIENKSMEIIEEVMNDTSYSEEEKIIVKRMIHTTGDFDYRHIVEFKNDFLINAKEAIKEGKILYTDTKMAFSGINKKALSKASLELQCFVGDDKVYKISKEKRTTRSAVAIDLAVSLGIDMFVIGNAPTALFRLCELIEEGKVNPRFVIGVPVGFVGAAESKEVLRKVSVPSISTVGTKGGSNVAASIVNALLYMAVGR